MTQGIETQFVTFIFFLQMSQPVKVGPRCPEDTPFKQQRLPAWQPILTPNWVIGTFLIVGCIFMPIGGAIYAASSSVQEIRINYGDISACKQNQKLTAVQFVVKTDMKTPFVYYELSNFYQNHRRYVTSRSDAQLRAAEDAMTTSNFDTAARNGQLATCNPLVCSGNAGMNGCGTTGAPIQANGRNNLVYYPCGLIARSLFNDTFANLRLDGAAAEIPLDKKNIAWPSDIEKKFISPNAERLKPAGDSPYGFIGKYCGAFGDVCTSQDAAHPDDTIANAACISSGWCNTPIDPSKPAVAPNLFTVAILRSIVGVTSGTSPCTMLPLASSSHLYNCWHRCAAAVRLACVTIPTHAPPAPPMRRLLYGCAQQLCQLSGVLLSSVLLLQFASSHARRLRRKLYARIGSDLKAGTSVARLKVFRVNAVCF